MRIQICCMQVQKYPFKALLQNMENTYVGDFFLGVYNVIKKETP